MEELGFDFDSPFTQEQTKAYNTKQKRDLDKQNSAFHAPFLFGLAVEEGGGIGGIQTGLQGIVFFS